MLMMLVVGYLASISGGTSCAKLDQALAILPMLPKLEYRCHSEAEVFAGTSVKLTNKVWLYFRFCNWI